MLSSDGIVYRVYFLQAGRMACRSLTDGELPGFKARHKVLSIMRLPRRRRM